MIISQTPLRIGLAGGGTDLPAYYRESGGLVLSCAIDKYVYVLVRQHFDDRICLNYSKKEIVSRVEDVEHDLIREALLATDIRGGVEISTFADIPSEGTGLGSSSAVTVGLLNALYAYQGMQVPARELAHRACVIEIERCGKPIGRQDQFITALGGIQELRFGPHNDYVQASRITLSELEHRALEKQIMLFYTGTTRKADSILADQNDRVRDLRSHLDHLHYIAAAVAKQFENGHAGAIGTAIRESWESKRQLGIGTTNEHIDRLIAQALGAGASGAKICGAGGGGFMLVICHPEYRSNVRCALAPLKELPVRIDPHGTRIMLNVPQDIWD